MTVKPLQPYQQRVVLERDALTERTQKLEAMIHSEAFSKINPDEQIRMHRQLSLQHQLIATLNERIAAF